MKGQVLHLMEVHFFMEGVFEVNIFDLLLIKIYRANRFAVEAGRKKKMASEARPGAFFCPPDQGDFLCFVAPLYLGSLCTAPPPPHLSKNRRRGGGPVHRLHLGACSQANRKGAPFI